MENISKLSRNVYQIELPPKKAEVAVLSDIHWDNPKCNRKLLTKHLNHCLDMDLPIVIVGDLFCLMQGRGDNRRNKSDILPEHNNAFYLDSIVDTAVEWFKPYVHNIAVIGYGNHECYREDTDVLTQKGWKNIKEVTLDDQVATFNQEHIYYEQPNALVSKHVNKLVHLEGSFSKQVVSGKHAVMYNDMRKVNAQDIISMTDSELPHNRKIIESTVLLEDKWIQLLTAVVMDATMVDHSKYNPTHSKKRIQFKLSKPEKIEYIKSLLDDLDISYTFKEASKTRVNKLQPYYIRIYSDAAKNIWNALGGVKQLPEAFSKLTGSNFTNLLTALENTDGSRENDNSLTWNTTSKHDVDIIQEACVLNGYHFTFRIKENCSGFGKGKTQYRSRISKEIVKNKKVKIHHEDYDGLVYCLNMPSGCFITRVDGKVAFSGNTGVIKYQETDILKRFVDKCNATYGSNIQIGGYGGWIIYTMQLGLNDTAKTSFKHKYFHGSGGGGIVTKGAINLTRALETYEGYDLFTMGHIHENASRTDTRETIYTNAGRVKIVRKDIHSCITGTYKEEYGKGEYGWHVERGAPPKTLGGRIVTFEVIKEDKKTPIQKKVDSRLFPL